MSQYYISGVWKSNNTLTHVHLHALVDGNLQKGVKTTEAHVIKLLEDNSNKIRTMEWSYKDAKWIQGAEVSVVVNRQTGRTFLRTIKDKTVIDNLDNIILMHPIL